MTIEFKKELSLIFIFSKDYSHYVLVKRQDKLDGFLYDTMDYPEISKRIYRDSNLKIEPSDLYIRLTMPSSDKSYRINVLTVTCDISNNDANCLVFNTDEIPSNSYPQCRWIIPLILDPVVLGTQFNQIILGR